MKAPAVLLASLLALAGCNYESPLAGTPTQAVDARLLGEWVQPAEGEWMVVRALDTEHYAIAYGHDKAGDRPDLYRAFHTDCAGLALISVQNLQPGDDHHKFSYVAWSLSPDGTKLTLRTVNTKVIPEGGGDPATQQKLVTAHAHDPALLNDPALFVRPGPP